MVNFLLRRKAWMTLYHLWIFLQATRPTRRIHWNERTSKVTDLHRWHAGFLMDVLTDLRRVLDDLEHFAQESGSEPALASVQESRHALEKLVVRMDGLESGFDRIAERSRTSITDRLILIFTNSLHSVVCVTPIFLSKTS